MLHDWLSFVVLVTVHNTIVEVDGISPSIAVIICLWLYNITITHMTAAIVLYHMKARVGYNVQPQPLSTYYTTMTTVNDDRQTNQAACLHGYCILITATWVNVIDRLSKYYPHAYISICMSLYPCNPHPMSVYTIPPCYSVFHIPCI